MANNKRSGGGSGTRRGAGDAAAARGRAAKAPAPATGGGGARSRTAASARTGRAAAQVAEQAVQRGARAAREGVGAAADTVGDAARRGAGEAAERGGGPAETVRPGEQGDAAAGSARKEGRDDAAARQSGPVRGAAEEAGRGLAGIAEEAVAGVRSLVGPPNAGPGEVRDAQHAMPKLVQAVMETNMRFAEELLRRTGPSAVADLQRRFIGEYFGALAQGGTLLLRAAQQAAEQSLRPLGPKAQGAGAAEAGGAKGDGTVADVMSRDVALASPDDTVQQAARLMRERDTGVLPVGEDDRLVGVVTDRDIAVRAAAAGKDPSKTKLREVMSGGEPRYVFADEPVEKAAASMAEQQVQRLPVLDRGKRLVGMLSLGDLARGSGGGVAGAALEGVSRPGGRQGQGSPDTG